MLRVSEHVPILPRKRICNVRQDCLSGICCWQNRILCSSISVPRAVRETRRYRRRVARIFTPTMRWCVPSSCGSVDIFDFRPPDVPENFTSRIRSEHISLPRETRGRIFIGMLRQMQRARRKADNAPWSGHSALSVRKYYVRRGECEKYSVFQRSIRFAFLFLRQ